MTEFEFIDMIARLDGRIGELKNGQFSKILADDPIKSIVQKELGILGGAFGITDATQNEFALLQRSSNPPYEGAPVMDFPYTEGISEEIGCLIDQLFIGRRHKQKLGDVVKVYNRIVFCTTPEFFQNLPPHKSPHALPFLPFEKKCREKPGYKFLYCTSGEVSFFLYAWRWLLRYCQMRDRNHQVSPEEDVIMRRPRSPIWQPEFWSGVADHESVENEWIKQVRGLPNIINKETDADKRDFLSNVLVGWESIKKKDDGTEPLEGLYTEWQYLGLLDSSDHVTQKLIALVKFARYVFTEYLTNSGDEIMSQEVPAKAREAIEEAEAEITTSFTWDDIRRLELDKSLRIIIYHLLSKGERQLKGVQLLIKLHQMARFPIIPYFCWTVLDEEHRDGPKAHLAFKVWSSDRFMADIMISREDGEMARKKTDVAVVCLLGIRPVWGDVDSGEVNMLEYNDDPKSHSKIILHLYRISTFCEHLSHPIVDGGFYWDIVREKAREWDAVREKAFQEVRAEQEAEQKKRELAEQRGRELTEETSLVLATLKNTVRSANENLHQLEKLLSAEVHDRNRRILSGVRLAFSGTGTGTPIQEIEGVRESMERLRLKRTNDLGHAIVEWTTTRDMEEQSSEIGQISEMSYRVLESLLKNEEKTEVREIRSIAKLLCESVVKTEKCYFPLGHMYKEFSSATVNGEELKNFFPANSFSMILPATEQTLKVNLTVEDQLKIPTDLWMLCCGLLTPMPAAHQDELDWEIKTSDDLMINKILFHKPLPADPQWTLLMNAFRKAVEEVNDPQQGFSETKFRHWLYALDVVYSFHDGYSTRNSLEYMVRIS